MSLEHINGVGSYNIICGSRNQCESKPGNPEAAAFESSYESWKAEATQGGFMVNLPNGSLIIAGPDPSRTDRKAGQTEVYSEGMAYGLYFAAMSGDRATFDKLLNGLENYAKNDNGLYAWRLSGKGEILESHSAADADLYAAASVTIAFAKWGDKRYQQVAQRLINALWEEEVLDYKGRLILLPSDGEWPRYKDGRFVFNPSHFSPALLKIIASADNNPKHNWNKLISDSYQLLSDIVNQSKELYPAGMNPIPDRVLVNIFEGKFNLEMYTNTQTPDTGYDSIRVYLELARDAATSKDPRALALADMILNAMPARPTPDTARLGEHTNEITSAYYGMLYLTSPQYSSQAGSFFSRLRQSYQGRFIGSTENDRKSYYFQSLMLHASSLLGGYSFAPASLRQFDVTPKTGYESYVPFKVSVTKDGSVYVRNVLIYKYETAYKGLSPYERAVASARAIKTAYLEGHLRPKYIGKVSDPEQGSMITSSYWGLRKQALFDIGPDDLLKGSKEEIGFRWLTGAYRRTTGWICNKTDWLCGSVSYQNIVPSQRVSWYASRKGALEWEWDNTYNRIYLNLLKSRVIDLRKEANLQLNDLSSIEKAANSVIDFYSLTNSARAREVADYSRAYDDLVSISKSISSFLHKNPNSGFGRPNGYYEALFSLATILSDQDRRYRITLVKDHLAQIEKEVRCREKEIVIGRCGDNIKSDLPIEGLANSRDYLEAAGKIIETVIQSDIGNLGYKARALREKANLAFRMMEKGEGLTDATPTSRKIVSDYLTALELWKNRTNLSGAENIRKHSFHKQIEQKLQKPENFYGIAEQYSRTAYKPEKIFVVFDDGDVFEYAKLFISLGKFYLFTHGQEERFELPHYSEIKYKGLKEAETWFKFVAEDPHGLFGDNSLKPYRIEAQIRLAVTRMQLGYLELSRKQPAAAEFYFDRAMNNGREAYYNIKVEINRLPSIDWVNEGVSMNLRDIYFNAMLANAVMSLNRAELSTDPAQSKELIENANQLMSEAVKNRDLILFGSTKTAVVKTAVRALLAEAEITPVDKLPVDRMASILKIDIMIEKEALNLQLLVLALMVYHCVKTTANLKEAEALLQSKIPFSQINYRVRRRLGAEEPSIKSLMQGLLLEKIVPDNLKKEFEAKLNQ